MAAAERGARVPAKELHRFDGQRATPANIRNATNEVWTDVQELWDALKAERWF